MENSMPFICFTVPMIMNGEPTLFQNPANYLDTLTLNDIPEGVYFVKWYNPVSGAVMSSEKRNWKGGNFTVITPPYSLDIALKISNP